MHAAAEAPVLPLCVLLVGIGLGLLESVTPGVTEVLDMSPRHGTAGDAQRPQE